MEALIRETSANPVVWNEDVECSMRLQYATELFSQRKNQEAIAQMMQAVSAKPTQAALYTWSSVLRQIGSDLYQLVDNMYNQMYLHMPVEDVVAIYTGASGYFTGSEMGGSGVWGSEMAAVNLAEALVALKIPVVIFCECLQFKPPKPHNGVTYLPHQFYGTWSANRPPKSVYLIISRYLSFFIKYDTRAAKRVFFWVHDKVPHYLTVGGGPPLPEQGRPLFRTLCSHNVIHHVVCVSNWQAEHVKELMANGEDPLVIGNAMSVVSWEPKDKVKGRMIFCSDPTRGLELLLKLFARIKEKAPYAELHVYWSSFDYPAQDGVVFKGKVSQSDLFSAMQEAQVLLYPNHGHETYCQVALEASAAGCHVIARDYSGIADVLRSLKCGTLIPGLIDENWQDAAVSKTLQMFDTESFYPTVVPTWSDRAKEWFKLFY